MHIIYIYIYINTPRPGVPSGVPPEVDHVTTTIYKGILYPKTISFYDVLSFVGYYFQLIRLPIVVTTIPHTLHTVEELLCQLGGLSRRL